MVVFFRTGYNYDRDAVSLATGVDCSVSSVTGEVIESFTVQAHKEECDINEIVRRFGLTGQFPENPRPPVSGDFTGVTDFQSAMEAVVSAQEAFMEFPAALRDRFKNDPQLLMDFVGDEKNREEAVKLGLVPHPPEKTRDVVQAVDELAAKLVPKPSGA